MSDIITEWLTDPKEFIINERLNFILYSSNTLSEGDIKDTIKKLANAPKQSIENYIKKKYKKIKNTQKYHKKILKENNIDIKPINKITTEAFSKYKSSLLVKIKNKDYSGIKTEAKNIIEEIQKNSKELFKFDK